jgi:hypothetical protein
MNYYVHWMPSAHDRLEWFWMQPSHQTEILRAANAIDELLAEDPFRHNEVRLGDDFTLIVEPLAVDYVVLEDRRWVVILNVWLIGFLDRDN